MNLRSEMMLNGKLMDDNLVAKYLVRKFKIEVSTEDINRLVCREPDQYIIEIKYPKGHKSSGLNYFNVDFADSIVRDKGEAQLFSGLLDAVLIALSASRFNKKVKAKILLVRWSF